MSEDNIVVTVRMRRRLSDAGVPLTSASIRVKERDGVLQRGIQMTWGKYTANRPFLVIGSLDPNVFWRALYATSKMFHVGEEAVMIAILIAIETPLNDPRFSAAKRYLSYDHRTPEVLREETFAQIIPKGDIKKIVAGFKRLGVPIDDPFTKVVGRNGATRDSRYRVGCRLVQPMSHWQQPAG